MHSNTNTQSESKVLWPERINQRKPEKAPSFCNLSHDQIQPNLGQILSNPNLGLVGVVFGAFLGQTRSHYAFVQ